MVFSLYETQRILHFYFNGFRSHTIAKLLREEVMRASKCGVAKFPRWYREIRMIVRKAGSDRSSKIMHCGEIVHDRLMMTLLPFSYILY